MIFTKEQVDIFELVLRHAEGSAWVAGGLVRDLLLGLSAVGVDIDFVIEGDAVETARRCGRALGQEVRDHAQFLTAKVLAAPGKNHLEIDFATARTETYPVPGALPVVQAGPMAEDLKRRDFTINAMALPVAALLEASQNSDAFDALKSQVLDPFGGRDDLSRRLIRILHAKSFIDDPTRIFRALRYAARLEGSLEPQTKALAEEAINGGALHTISWFRRLTEIRKIPSERGWYGAMQQAAAMKVFSKLELVPEGFEPNLPERLAASEPPLGSLTHEQRIIEFLKVVCAERSAESAGELLRSMGYGKKAIKNIIGG